MRPISRYGGRWPIFRKVATAEQAAGLKVAPWPRRNDAGLAAATAMAFPTCRGQSSLGAGVF